MTERYAVIFDNDMSNALLLSRTRDAHHRFLNENRQWIRMAGATRSLDGEQFTGEIWVVEGRKRDEVEVLVQAAPFVIAGIHKSYQIVWWGSAPGFENAEIGP